MSHLNGETDFIHLHIHSVHSNTDAMLTIEEIATYCKGNAAALTDLGNMAGCLQFQNEMIKANKKPILGIEAYVDSIIQLERKAGYHLILLAKNDQGVQDLFQLSSKSYESIYNISNNPVIQWDWIRKHAHNFVCLTGCSKGEIASLAKKECMRKKTPLLDKALIEMKTIFKEDLYLEIQRHGLHKEEEYNKLIIHKSKEFSIKPVATIDAHIAKKEQEKAHHIWLCIQKDKKVGDPKAYMAGNGYYLKSPNEMLASFSDIPEAIYNTLEVATKCNGKITTGKCQFPRFEVPKEYTNQYGYLKKLAESGLQRRFERLITPYDREQYKSRLLYELETVKKVGYSGYFLVVWDIVNYCNLNGISIGPGRGSAVGSLLAYCLGITDVNPLIYSLSFERFLNPERVSLPDIDLDIEHNRRDEVLQYLTNKYGAEHIAMISKNEHTTAKAILKDVARVFQVPYQEVNKCTKNITSTLTELLNDPESLRVVKSHLRGKSDEIIQLASELENRICKKGLHPCGILIAPENMNQFLPLCKLKNEQKQQMYTASQIAYNDCENLGILKFDLLPLRTLTVIKETINSLHKQGIPIDIGEIPMNDVTVFRTLATDYIGLFQIDSKGMKALLKKLYTNIDIPENQKENDLFERLIAAIALYRPGPMAEIDNYIDASHSTAAYDVPELEPILSSTYGIFIYQEQIMSAFKTLAGYSDGQADDIRKAISKKSESIIVENEILFIHGSSEYDAIHPGAELNIKGCLLNNIPLNSAKAIWEKIKKFGAYAFNKSHAAAYAVLTYRTAYLYTYYREEFVANLLNSYIDDKEAFKFYIGSLRKLGIPLIPPKLNSHSKFTAYTVNGKKCILFGLSGVTGANNVKNADSLVNKSSHTENDILHFMLIMYMQIQNNLINFAYAGIFDDFMPRKQAVEMCERFNAYMQKENFKNITWSLLLGRIDFDVHQYTNPNAADFNPYFKLNKEKEILNCFASQHPTELAPQLIRRRPIPISKLSYMDKKDAAILCFIGAYEVKQDRDNKNCARLTVEDKTGGITCMLFEAEFDQYHSLIKQNEVLLIKGTVQDHPKYGLSMHIKQVSLPEDEPYSQIIFITKDRYHGRICAHRILQAAELCSTLNKGSIKISVQFQQRTVFLGYTNDRSTIPPLLHICNNYQVS